MQEYSEISPSRPRYLVGDEISHLPNPRFNTRKILFRNTLRL